MYRRKWNHWAGSAPVNGDTVKNFGWAVFNIPICKVEHIKDYFLFAS
jgi:23S rRNA (guanosine2251-2'-O)-methyltransferase